MKKTRCNESINDFLKRNKKKKPVSFHMPGHKYGRYPFKINIKKYSKFDISEIPGADNIKKPTGIILEAQKKIALAYNSEEVYFLTNGSTSGVLAILRYAALSDKKIMISRDVHMSVVNGAILFGVDTVFIPVSKINRLDQPVSADDVQRCLEKNQDVCGILITSPNYYGNIADIKRIAQLAHGKRIFLGVDEAHGAHFAFSGQKHFSGIKNGADFVCHSLHKTLPVYNQGALLHVNGDIIDRRKIREAVSMMGTTSPSYPLLASMEKAVSFYSERGDVLYKKLAGDINCFKEKLLEDKRYRFVSSNDFSRIVINIEGVGRNGYDILSVLHEKYRIDIEMADFTHVVLVTSPSNRKSDFTKLYKALTAINSKDERTPLILLPQLPEKAMEMHNAYKIAKKTMSYDMVAGCICGTIIVSYPPGIPIICPGEIVNRETLKFIRMIIARGGTVLGAEKNGIPVLE